MMINNIGKFLYEQRKKHGFSQSEAANRSRISCSYLSLIEQGKRMPPLHSLQDILKLYGYQIQIVEINKNDSI